MLDIGLPDGSGFDLLAHIRKDKNKTPVDSNELIARIRSVIRRNTQNALPILTIGDLIVKPAEHIATANKTALNLTAKEFAVLEYLAQHSGQIITRTMLMDHIWGSDFETFSNVIDVYIGNLRRKIEKHCKSCLITGVKSSYSCE